VNAPPAVPPVKQKKKKRKRGLNRL
jgi:hypothetical protein